MYVQAAELGVFKLPVCLCICVFFLLINTYLHVSKGCYIIHVHVHHATSCMSMYIMLHHACREMQSSTDALGGSDFLLGS